MFSPLKIAGYSGVFVLFVSVLTVGYQKPEKLETNVASVQNVDGSTTTQDQKASPSVDQIMATNVAASVTEQADLPISANISNMAQSMSAKSDISQADDTTIAKPQIIQPKSTDLAPTTYVTKKGDTVQSVAAQFNISGDTVRWANDLSLDALPVKKKLTILPVDGVLYTYKKGDSVKSLAKKYKTSTERIVSYNNLELSKAKSGQKLVLPGGVLPNSARPGYSETDESIQQNGGNTGIVGGDMGSVGSGSVINPGISGASVGNRYAPGNCTWYAYERREQLGKPVGSFWGNANTWAINARSAGYRVDGKPAQGAVLVDQAGYYGHVAIVESVRDNGDILISEMNNYAYGGFNVVDKRVISAGQASSYQYIH